MDALFKRAPAVQKPWLLLGRVKNFFEDELQCSTAELLRSHFIPYFHAKTQRPVVIGSAHLSGNLYIGMPAGGLTATQAMIANVFTHGEIGIDFISSSSSEPFTRDEEFLLSQLATAKVMRMDDGSDIPPRKTKKAEEMSKESNASTASSSSSSSSSSSDSGEAASPKKVEKSLDDLGDPSCSRMESSESLTKTKRYNGFRSFPRAKSLFTHDVWKDGNLLQHKAYLDDKWELEGDNENEWLVSMAKYMKYQAYPPEPVDGVEPVGVSALYDGRVFGGSPLPTIEPIQMLGTAMLANGVHPSQVEKVCFTGKIDDRIRLWSPNCKITTC